MAKVALGTSPEGLCLLSFSAFSAGAARAGGPGRNASRNGNPLLFTVGRWDPVDKSPADVFGDESLKWLKVQVSITSSTVTNFGLPCSG